VYTGGGRWQRMGSTGPQQWELTADQRAVTVERITASITNLAFARGVSLPLDYARQAASKAEKKAYTVAQVESRTTTGVRPEAESLAAYTRWKCTCSRQHVATAYAVPLA
jgi:hypothetical protein